MFNKDKYYTKLMNQLEIIHAENLSIMQALFAHSGVPKEQADNYVLQWDKRFQEERRNW